MTYEYHEGSQAEKPLSVDTTSSPTLVYLRRNIEEIERTDEMSGEKVKLWGYEEAIISHNEYEQMLCEQISDIQDLVVDIAYNETLNDLGL